MFRNKGESKQPVSNYRVPTTVNCRWPGCHSQVGVKDWGCERHLVQMPAAIKKSLIDNYRHGQDLDKEPSADYIKAYQELQHWILNNHNSTFH